jgi:hypothetical protein
MEKPMFAFARALLIAFTVFPVISVAQSAPVPQFARVPTTHILAIGHFTSSLTPEQTRSIMPHEVSDTLRLILAGKIDQSWIRRDGAGPIFLMNVTSVEEAHALLEKLPLGQAKLMDFDLYPVGPLGPLQILLPDATPASTK